MKWTALFLFGALALPAQQFNTGQAGRLVIGQPNFTAQVSGASATILGAAGGVAFGGDTLIVVDSNRIGATPQNNRVLVYRDIRSQLPALRAPVPQTGGVCPACVGQATQVIGQATMEETKINLPAANTVYHPIGAAYNGKVLAIADTDFNRVLIYNSLPTTDNAPADFVVGQPDFKTVLPITGANGLRGPQGVFLDANDGLWVADTSSSRVLYYGKITKNGQDAILVLGQPNFTSNNTTATRGRDPSADALDAPTAVYSDGTRLFVADLGFNRVLIWNKIPTANTTPADVVIGQPDMKSRTANNVEALCPPLGEISGIKIYGSLCGKTLSLPRSVVSDGTRLYVADSGNDRVTVYEPIPTENGADATVVLGQQAADLNQASDSAEPQRVSATDSFKTPGSLAWDGQNLYVADIYNRRVMIYSPGDFGLPLTAVRNAPSPEVYAIGAIAFSGTTAEGNVITITIGNDTARTEDDQPIAATAYKHTVTKDESFDSIILDFVNQINVTNPNQWATASPNLAVSTLLLTARNPGTEGNQVTLGAAVTPDTSTILTQTSGTNLKGGQNAAAVAPYALVTVLGENLSDVTTPIQPLDQPLPLELGGVEFFVNGIQAPLIGVSPTRVLAQIPIQMKDTYSAEGFLRVKRSDGTITVSTPVGIQIIGQNPSVFEDQSIPPAAGLAYHFSSSAVGTISVDGVAKVGETASVFIRERQYTYTVKTDDTLQSVVDGFVAIINEQDPEVEAFPSGTFTRLRLRARTLGPQGNGIPISASAPATASIIMTPLNNQLCCANQAGAIITEENPAQPGETIVVLATGLGILTGDDEVAAMKNGQPYEGPVPNNVAEFVSSLAGGKTANVLYSGLRKGMVGIYEVHLELNPDLPTNNKMEVTIAQSFQVSNIFTIPLVNPLEEPPQ